MALDQMASQGQPEQGAVTISIYEASVGVFVPYLGNLSALLDHAAAHARARNIEPSVLPNMRLHPNMYSLRQQVGEANRPCGRRQRAASRTRAARLWRHRS